MIADPARHRWVVLLGVWLIAVLAEAGAIVYFLGLLAATGALRSSIGVGEMATAVAASAAVTALFLGWYQLRGSTLQARATVLLSLDQRWEVELDAPRQALYALVDRVTPVGAPVTPAVVHAELARLRTSAVAAERENLRTLFRVIGFFETVALATRASYIRIEDVDNLLGGSIRHADLVFDGEIALQQQVDPRLYEHWSWLVGELRRRDARA